jgi:hypothetical protein
MGDRSVAVGALVTAFTVQAWRGFQHAEIPPARSFVGLVVASVILGGIGTFAPDLAAGLAVLVLLAVLLGVSDPATLGVRPSR